MINAKQHLVISAVFLAYVRVCVNIRDQLGNSKNQ